MRTHVACYVLVAMLLSAPAYAQSESAPAAPTPVVKVGTAVRTADNHFLGHVEEVQPSSGQPLTISIIYDQRFIHIPVSTLSVGKNDGLITSLSMKDVARLQ